MVADLHALTNPESVTADELRSRTREVIGLYLASGLDPLRSVIFRQSHVAAHTELAWILNCVTPIGWLQRMTQFKAKAKTSASTPINTGLLTYPILQAADILLYQADYVPVGEDQIQHIELTRDIAERFNSLFGRLFRLPSPLSRESGAKVMGLDDPTIKMSKSRVLEHPGHAILMLDDPDTIRRKVMRATTDSRSAVDRSSISAGIHNLLVLYATLAASASHKRWSALRASGTPF